MRILCGAALASMTLCSSAMAVIDVFNDPQFEPVEVIYDPDPDWLPIRFDYEFSPSEVPDLVAAGGTSEALIAVYSDSLFWEDWSYGGLVDWYDGQVPPEFQPWETAGPHEAEFVISDPTRTRIYGSFVIDLTDEEISDRVEFSVPDFPFTEGETWRDVERIGGGIGYVYLGEFNAHVRLNALGVADLNAALLTGTEFSVVVDVPATPLFLDDPDGVAPGRPAVLWMDSTVWLGDPIPEPSTVGLLAVGLAVCGVWARLRWKSVASFSA